MSKIQTFKFQSSEIREGIAQSKEMPSNLNSPSLKLLTSPKKVEIKPIKLLLAKHKRLFEAISKNNYQIIANSGFLYNESDANCKDEIGNTPLYYAAKASNFIICKFLFSLQANPNEHCINLNTPTHMAFNSATLHDLDVLKLFFQNNANLNILNRQSNTPLAFGKFEVLKYFKFQKGICTCVDKNKNMFDNNQLIQNNYISDQNYQIVFPSNNNALSQTLFFQQFDSNINNFEKQSNSKTKKKLY